MSFFKQTSCGFGAGGDDDDGAVRFGPRRRRRGRTSMRGTKAGATSGHGARYQGVDRRLRDGHVPRVGGAGTPWQWLRGQRLHRQPRRRRSTWIPMSRRTWCSSRSSSWPAPMGQRVSRYQDAVSRAVPDDPARAHGGRRRAASDRERRSCTATRRIKPDGPSDRHDRSERGSRKERERPPELPGWCSRARSTRPAATSFDGGYRGAPEGASRNSARTAAAAAMQLRSLQHRQRPLSASARAATFDRPGLFDGSATSSMASQLSSTALGDEALEPDATHHARVAGGDELRPDVRARLRRHALQRQAGRAPAIKDTSLASCEQGQGDRQDQFAEPSRPSAGLRRDVLRHVGSVRDDGAGRCVCVRCREQGRAPVHRSSMACRR